MQEGTMGGWKTVFEDEVEGRLVTVKVYESKEPEDQHEAPAVRVTTTFLDAYEDVLEPTQDSHPPILVPEVVGRTITLEPYNLDDLEGELIEVGFRPEAAVSIVSKIPL
jgi:hypothetical protein